MNIIKILAKNLLADLKRSHPRSNAVETFGFYLFFEGKNCSEEALLGEIKLLRTRLNTNLFNCCGLFRSPAVKKIDDFFDEMDLIKEKCLSATVFNLAIATYIDMMKSQSIFSFSFCIAATQAFNELCVMPFFLTDKEDIKKAGFTDGFTHPFPDELRIERAKENRKWVTNSLLYKFFGIGSSYLKKLDRFIHISSVVVEERDKEREEKIDRYPPPT